MADKTDLLVLGATGYTGRLVTRYLSAHPQRKSFTFAVGARSSTKLQTLLEDLDLHKDPSVPTIQVDVTNESDVEKAVKSTRVVINTVGPYWRWGTPVVRACAKHGVHYVDLTGETVWIKHIIREYDFAASRTGAIIVPSCGFDSIPSDIAAFLSNKALKSLPTPLDASTSTSAFGFKGGVSGGTINSIMTAIEQIPREDLEVASRGYSLSPVSGQTPPRPSLYYSLPVPGARPLVGAFYLLGPSNRSIVQRTFGLLELEARTSPSKQAELARYGPKFNYDEFMIMPSVPRAVLFTTAFVTGLALISTIQPVRPYYSTALNFVIDPSIVPMAPQEVFASAGTRAFDEDMQRGHFTTTNITKSSSEPPVYVKTVLKGKGDPGYLLTAVMISESALSLIFPPDSSQNSPQAARAALPPLGQRGGVLTPMLAFGDVLIKRLEANGRFEFSSSVVTEADAKKRD